MEKLEEIAREEEESDPLLAAELRGYADDVRGCGIPWRCEKRWCPRCMRRKAIHARIELERRLMRFRSMDRLLFVTLMVGTLDLERGWRVLKKAIELLLGRRFWGRAVVGASLHKDVIPASGEWLGWNLHVHLIVELRDGKELDETEVADAWGKLLADRGVSGSSDVRPVWLLWDKKGERKGTSKRSPKPFSPLAFYLTRQVRREWLRHSADILVALCRFLPRKRLSSLRGIWRYKSARAAEAAKRRTATPPPPARTVEERPGDRAGGGKVRRRPPPRPD